MRSLMNILTLTAGLALASFPVAPCVWAAAPDKNSVDTEHLKRNAVNSSRIRNGTIRSQDI